jgi:hypothetical protein
MGEVSTIGLDVAKAVFWSTPTKVVRLEVCLSASRRIRYAEEEAQAGRDWYEASTSWRSGFAGPEHCRCDPPDRRDRGGLRDELLDGEIFYTLKEAQIIAESWRRHYNTVRPHASLGYRAPAPEVFVPAFAAWPAAQSRPAPPATLTLAPRSTLN